METTLNYQTAYNELLEITREIESEEVSVDELSKKVKRAAELLEICNAKLKNTEEEVNKIIEKINSKQQ